MIVLPLSSEGAVPVWATIELQGEIALREGLEEKDLQVGTLATSCLVRPFQSRPTGSKASCSTVLLDFSGWINVAA